MSYFSLFQSPHPARGATRGEEAAADITDNFNPRTPRGVRRITGLQSLVTQVQFQSTHPARGATKAKLAQSTMTYISIHAPREGCDTPWSGRSCGTGHFNPRTPRGVRRRLVCGILCASYFNPRTPRGVRQSQPSTPAAPSHFNPRTPRGVRLRSGFLTPTVDQFQSTHPARGATIPLYSDIRDDLIISIHAPREGCDILGSRFSSSPSNFNPRTPRGVRHGQRSRHQRFFRISIHAPREGCDQVCKA